MKQIALGAALVLVGLVIGQSFNSGRAVAQQPAGSIFHEQDIRFSAADIKPTIPTSWRVIGIANGRTINENTLWLQDEQNTIHVLHLLNTEGSQMIISEKDCVIRRG